MKNYKEKYLKYKNKYFELKNMIGGNPKTYKLLGYYTNKDKDVGWNEPKDSGEGEFKFTTYERQCTIYIMCCVNIEDINDKIEIRLWDTEEEGNVRVFTYGHINIKIVDNFEKPLEYVPKKEESYITLDIDRPIVDFKCIFFDISVNGGNGYMHNGFVHIRREQFRQNDDSMPVSMSASMPVSMPASMSASMPASMSASMPEHVSKKYGFKYLQQQREYTTYYSLENECIIQQAIEEKRQSVQVSHIVLKGVNKGNKLTHNINLQTNTIENKDTRGVYSFIHDA
jgi:hypothetical protein